MKEVYINWRYELYVDNDIDYIMSSYKYKTKEEAINAVKKLKNDLNRYQMNNENFNKVTITGRIMEVEDYRTRYFDYDEETYYICSNCHEPILKDEPFEKINNMYFHKKDCE